MGRIMATVEVGNPRTAYVLQLRVEGKTYKQIREILNVTIGRVRQLVAKAKYRQYKVKKAKLRREWQINYELATLLPIKNQIEGLISED
jgi:DNA-directed RNA polymerase sigma subunit (sigma70/sigma32)